MTELPAGFANPFLISSGVLGFHCAAVYSLGPPADFQETTINQKQLNFTHSFIYLFFVAVLFLQSSCNTEEMKQKKVKFYFSIHCISLRRNACYSLSLHTLTNVNIFVMSVATINICKLLYALHIIWKEKDTQVMPVLLCSSQIGLILAKKKIIFSYTHLGSYNVPRTS